jgi:predicted Zn finger-like uncharacterized protein
MALVTRCSNPACLTLFRVTPAQLQAFGGQVRCGSCSTVFDAFPSLTTVADAALTAPAPAPAPPDPGPGQGLAAATAAAAADTPGAGTPGTAADAGTTASSPAMDRAPGAARPIADEQVHEWAPAAVAPGIGAGWAPHPMTVEHVADLSAEDTLDFAYAPVRSGTQPRLAVAPAHHLQEETPAVPAAGAAAVPVAEPLPPVVPELTDYSLTDPPPRRATPPARRTPLVALVGGLLLMAAVAILVAGSDRLPAPLSHWLAPATLATLLREHALPVAVALVGVLWLVLRHYRATWIVAATVLALLLGGQLVFAYRTQIAAQYPASRPLLESLCRLASCEVGLPKAADQLVIESSDLQAVDAARPNLIQLAASVRNRAPVEVAFPAIEVTLTDAQDRPLARRVLLPEQYLAGRPSVSAGLRAGEAFSIRLTLDTTELRPVGYRLYLFHP